MSIFHDFCEFVCIYVIKAYLHLLLYDTHEM